ncbi:MAG: UbiD family decarboxylase [Gemmataceae bacterium]
MRQLPQLVLTSRATAGRSSHCHRSTARTPIGGWRHANLGMYRVQLSGNRYETDREVGLHYQIHRGIGVHHAAALRKECHSASMFVGGPPAARRWPPSSPLPEGLPELAFAGVLGGRVRLVRPPAAGASAFLPMPAEADFCIVGTVMPERQRKGRLAITWATTA